MASSPATTAREQFPCMTCATPSTYSPVSGVQPMLVHAFETSQGPVRNELETEVERFQSKVKKSVAQDIRKMLQGSKPYIQHYGNAATISKTKLRELSTPKVNTVHEETAMLIEAGDYQQYAQVRADQLQTRRSRQEIQNAQEQELSEQKACQLDSYRNWKAQMELQKAARKAHEAREQQKYGQQLAKYVAYKADRELDASKARRQAQQQPLPGHVVHVVEINNS